MKANDIIFDEQGTVRSGWRAGVFLTAFLIVGVVVAVIAQVAFGVLGLEASPASPLFLAVNGLVSLIVALLFGWACGRLFEKLPFSALGASFTGRWAINFAVGLVVGTVAVTIAVLIAYIGGGLTFAVDAATGTLVARDLGASLVVFALAAAFEEALFRGYILQTFARSGLAWMAIALTSVFFGLVHLGNPSASWISTLNTVLAGVLFSVAYLKTRDLWLPFGIHLMWNWVQGSIFGIEVSGLTTITPHPLLKELDRGPVWLTGETYGIEGSIACTAALIICIGMVMLLPKKLTTDMHR